MTLPFLIVLNWQISVMAFFFFVFLNIWYTYNTIKEEQEKDDNWKELMSEIKKSKK